MGINAGKTHIVDRNPSNAKSYNLVPSTCIMLLFGRQKESVLSAYVVMSKFSRKHKGFRVDAVTNTSDNA